MQTVWIIVLAVVAVLLVGTAIALAVTRPWERDGGDAAEKDAARQGMNRPVVGRLLHGHLVRGTEKSPHFQLKVGSAELERYNNEVVKPASNFWHRVAKANGIRYSISGGNLLGYARSRQHIPWDDDMDVYVEPKGYHFLNKLFNEGKDVGEVLNHRWEMRVVRLLDRDVYLYAAANYSFYKLKLTRGLDMGTHIGGVDLFYPMELHKYDVMPGLEHFDRPDRKLLDMPLHEVTYDGITAMAPSCDVRAYLEERYNANWWKMKHPSIPDGELFPPLIHAFDQTTADELGRVSPRHWNVWYWCSERCADFMARFYADRTYDAKSNKDTAMRCIMYHYGGATVDAQDTSTLRVLGKTKKSSAWDAFFLPDTVDKVRRLSNDKSGHVSFAAMPECQDVWTMTF